MSNLRGSKAEIYELGDIKASSLGSQAGNIRARKLNYVCWKQANRPTEEQELVTVELFKRYFQNG